MLCTTIFRAGSRPHFGVWHRLLPSSRGLSNTRPILAARACQLLRLSRTDFVSLHEAASSQLFARSSNARRSASVLPSRWVMGGNARLAHFYYAFGIVFLRRCYHQILRPRRRLSEFANGFCRH